MPIDPTKWQNLLDTLDASSGGGDVYFLKQQKTRIRLVHPDLQPGSHGSDEEEIFYAETTKHYQGKASSAFIVFGVVMGTSEKADKNVDPAKIRAIRMPKTALRGIIAQLAEGWDLFDESEGRGLVIEKIGGGSSDRTSYTVQVSPKAVKIDLSGLIWPEKDIWTIAAEESARSEDRDSKKNSDKPARGRHNVPQDVTDEDEELPF